MLNPSLGISVSVGLKWGLEADIFGELAQGHILGAPKVKHTEPPTLTKLWCVSLTFLQAPFDLVQSSGLK